VKTFVYVYKAANATILTKKIKAANYKEAENFLKKKNINAISLKQEGYSIIETLTKPTSVESEELVAFAQLFAGCIRTGLKIKETLQLLSKQLKNRLLTEALEDIIISIESGTSISDSFAKHSKIFPNYLPMALKAGEASGRLADVLDYVANYLEKTDTLKKQVTGIMTYPIIVSSIGIAMLSLILVFVAPTFKKIFKSSGKELPLPTQILFGSSEVLIQYYPTILAVISLFILLFILINRSPTGKFFIHKALYTIPLSGPIYKQVKLLQFLGCFEILVKNDVPITQSLIVLEEATENLRLKQIITEMRKDVARGLPLSGALVENKAIVPVMVSYTVSMGEKAGNLGESLARITSFMDKELSHNMKKLSSRLDPIITLVLGMIVLFIAIAIYLPIFDLMMM
tara:strand:- start:1785 stop:2987 length:1203 start_codon:yes stop_codon:yes gene_type:complete